MTKASTDVVKLRVEYGEEDQYIWRGCAVEIEHDGRLGKWDYHRSVLAVVLGRPVPPGRIALVAEYDLCTLVR